MVIEVRLYGALKSLTANANGVVECELPDAGRAAISGSVTIEAVRAQLKTSLLESVLLESVTTFPLGVNERERYAALIDRSVLSDGTRILQNNEILEMQSQLALLPPVCGG